jgi:dynein heavy chain 2
MCSYPANMSHLRVWFALAVLQGPPSNNAYFTACLQRNLRVAISLDPANEDFSRRLEQNPALTSCCSMLWWQGWSDSSLTAMARARLQVWCCGRCRLNSLVCDDAVPLVILLQLAVGPVAC